jgi:phosphotransferase system enzyme I (PtsI)
VIGIVVVSHSPRLAQAAVDLALEMVPGEKPAIAIAAGAGEGVIGTDATKVADAIRQVASPDGVLVVMDLGSAVLSAEMALEFVADPSIRVRLTSAPFVEGLLAGIVRAASGATLDEVELEARGALGAKAGQLEEPVASVAVPASVADPAEAPGASRTVDLTLANPSGLHIRPAAMLVAALTGLDAVVTIANLRTSSAQAAANSPTALLMLAARKGDTVRVAASGVDAEAAIAAVAALVADGFGETSVAEPVEAPPSTSSRTETGSGTEPQPRTARGGPLGVSPGRAVGPVVRMSEPLVEPAAAAALAESDRAGAADRINAALASVAADLRARAERVSGEAREILEATATMAADPSLLSAARQSVQGRGDSSERAIWTAIADIAALFSAQGGRIGERVTDLYDVRNRALAELLGRRAPGIPERSEPFVLVARDLAPADTALLDPATCRAIVTVEGGPTSHTAILAKALGIPALVAVTGALNIPEGTIVLVDGTAGTLTIDPAAELIAAVEAQVVGTTVEFDGSGHTADGHPVQLLANVGSPESVESAVTARAEGIGLFRTEFLFLERAEAPTVAEQTAAYRKVFAAFPGRKVIIRTLDAGADKPLAFVTAAGEDNPALGVRGYRTSWRRPDLIDAQLAAIAAAAAAERAEVQVMAPMIDTPDEAADFASRCAAAGLASVGVMIETPAAAITAPEIFAHVNFVSLGTNDLAQYTMAADRLLGDLALLNDPWQPAVLRMIRLACDAGTAAGKPVGVCGEAAADPLLAAVLIGLGASSLSMSPRALGHVGELLAGVTLGQCRAAATDAVGARTATSARDAAVAALGLAR